MPKYKIIKSHYGIANRFSNYEIVINKKLFLNEYKPLLKEIIKHEIKHTDTGYEFIDLYNDLVGFKNKKLYYKFILTTPKSWVQFSPFYIYGNKFYFDISIIIFYFFTVIILGGFIYGLVQIK